MIEINKVIDYKISQKAAVLTLRGQSLYDMYIVTLTFQDKTQKKIKVFTDINSIDINDKQLAKEFVIDRLLGENGLIKKEGRDDYIFLGKLSENVKGQQIPNRYYKMSGTNKNAQQFFDEDIYPMLKEKYKDNINEREIESKKCKIYNEIKSPFEDEKVLQQLVELYVDKKVTCGAVLYNKIITLEPKNENESEKHYKEFYKNIQFPNYAELYSNMRLGRDNSIPKDPRVENIFSIFKTYEFLHKYAIQNNAINIFHLNVEGKYYEERNDKEQMDKSINELKKLKLTNEENAFRYMVGWTEIQLKKKFMGGPSVMGFHVNPQNLECENKQPHREKSEMKFYINAGYDTYRFARYFQEKCKQNQLNYYFKVVDPTVGEHERSDKLCIYTELKDADIFLQLIKDIKEEHPDIKYRKPPILVGTIQDFIGVGTDDIPNRDSSYNDIMSSICFSAMENVFKGIPKNEILYTINRNPELLQKMKSMIISKATALGMSSEKICIREDSIPKLRNAELQRQIKQAQEEGKNLDEQIRNSKGQYRGE